jgi:hypothetical protein
VGERVELGAREERQDLGEDVFAAALPGEPIVDDGDAAQGTTPSSPLLARRATARERTERFDRARLGCASCRGPTNLG